MKLTSILIVFYVLASFTVAQAQNPVDILEADRIEGGLVNGQKVQKIIGNVFLKSLEQDLEMYCDSAYQFIGSSEIRAYGNIQINTGNEKIWADSLVYFTDIDFSRLRGRVIIEADSTTLFGNSVDYRFSSKVAHFIDEIRLEDPEGVLTANSGFYYREADSAVFRGQVQLRDSTQYIEGDSLFSNRGKEYYEMYGEIFAVDGDNNSTLKGEYLEADSTGRRLLRGNAWLKNIKKDTAGTAEQDSAAKDLNIITSFRPDTISVGQDSLGQTTSPEDRSDSVSVSQQPITHRIQTGETLFSIAQMYKATVQELKEWNDLQDDVLSIGQTLLLKSPQSINIVNHTVQAKETLFSLSKQYEVNIEQLKSWNNLTDNNLIIGQELTIYKHSTGDDSLSYTVQKGDSLFKIAREHNMSLEELKKINDLTSNTITTGQQLKVSKPQNQDSPVTPDSLYIPADTLTALTQSVEPDTSSSTARADTTHIRAHRILSVRSSTGGDTSTVVNAYEEVSIWSQKFSAISDTSRYDDLNDTFELWSGAKTWHNEVQLSGPYIKVFLEDGEIDQLQAYPSPFAVQQDTSLDRLNQIKGDTLNAYFQDGSLRQIHVFGGSHLLRFTKNEQGQPDGAVDLTAPSTRIFFEDGELVELKSTGAIDGSYLPESEQTAKRQLEGFIWTPKLRPQRPEENMFPRFPPIPELRPFELPRRYVNYIENKSSQ